MCFYTLKCVNVWFRSYIDQTTIERALKKGENSLSRAKANTPSKKPTVSDHIGNLTGIC